MLVGERICVIKGVILVWDLLVFKSDPLIRQDCCRIFTLRLGKRDLREGTLSACSDLVNSMPVIYLRNLLPQ